MQGFRDWRYSSYRVMHRAEVVKWFGTKEDYLSLHNQRVSDARAKWLMGSEFDNWRDPEGFFCYRI